MFCHLSYVTFYDNAMLQSFAINFQLIRDFHFTLVCDICNIYKTFQISRLICCKTSLRSENKKLYPPQSYLICKAMMQSSFPEFFGENVIK